MDWKAICQYQYYRWLAPYQNVIRCEGKVDDATLPEWIGTLKGFERVVVVAAGPSASLMVPSGQNLYITTNSAINLIEGYSYIYFVSEGTNVCRYLKRGVSQQRWLGTVIREEVSTGSAAVTRVAKAVSKYKSKYRRSGPEIFASDLYKEGDGRDNYEYFERVIRESLDTKFKQFNSGFGALQVAYCIAVVLNRPLDIYGLDAGNGGPVHFDGTQSGTKSVSGERVRTKLAGLLQALYAQDQVEVNNYSYYLGTKTPPDFDKSLYGETV